MSLWTLDTDRIVRMFNANGIKMSLSKAFEVAGYIENLHLERLNEVSNLHFDQGQAEGLRKAEKSYETGYREGQRSAGFKLEESHMKTIIEATLWVENNISFGNLSKKIRCIKEVRTKFPSLGLRECKFIIDEATGNGVGLYF